MEISKDKINKFLSLSDDELKKRMGEAARKNGMASDQLSAVINNVSSLKRLLASMSEQDFKKIINMFGEDKLAQMIDDMKL